MVLKVYFSVVENRLFNRFSTLYGLYENNYVFLV